MEDYLNDFSKIEDIDIKEKLTNEEIQEGLTPMIFNFKVLFTYHALDRIETPGDRECDYFEVIKLLKTTPQIINQSMGQELRVLSHDRTLCVVCKIGNVEDMLSIKVITVISNKIYRNNKIIQEKISIGKGNYVIQ